MGSQHLRLRENWQRNGGTNAFLAENMFGDAFEKAFSGTEYSIEKSPKDFQNIYVNYPLSPEDAALIYTPDKAINRHGVVPDYVIRNNRTGKCIYIEVKRQDGWVENGVRSDGRGNAHERSCKFFTPGLLNRLRGKSHIDHPHLPFWVVFIGNITRDPCRVREVTLWYEGHQNHFFFWRNAPDADLLFLHFENGIAPLLE